MNARGFNWGFNHPVSFRGARGHGARGTRGFRPFRRGARNTFTNISYDRGGGYRGGGGRPYNNYGNRKPNQPWTNRPTRETPGKRLSEDAIGVTEYVNDNKGFIGIIKSRYSDFQVSEINEKGEIAKLTDLSPPAAPFEEAVDEDEDLVINKYNLAILPMNTWDEIYNLAVSKASEEKVEIDVTGISKEQRTKIHDSVKKAFGDSIVSSTVTVEDKKLVRFEKYRKGVRIDNRVKWEWPGEYVYFIVYKENCDTMDAAVRIAKRLGLNIKPSMIGYAGTKDRRAKTSQWFSLRKVDPRRVATACRGLRDVLIGNYSFGSDTLKLGMLKGNRFRIGLRNVTAPDEHVHEACRLLKERGFINYYGLQRFGTRADAPTYQIGLKLLQGNFKEAIDIILAEREGPWEEALRVYAARGAGAALRAWPRQGLASIERRLLTALARAPADLVGAVSNLARNTRLLYLHAYQSLVWNRAASARLRTLGAAPAPGDLVALADQPLEEELREDDSDNEDNGSETDAESQGGRDAENESKMADENEPSVSAEKPISSLETSIKEQQKIPVKILTHKDVDSGKYSIFDIILPLPGNNIEYPPNMKELYQELLTKDGLTLDMRHKMRSYRLGGAYRRLVVRPVEVSWRFVRYSDPFADLLASDRDLLDGTQLDGIEEDGKYKALLLDMTLPPSCYATMALRELLKVDTSCDIQALQNDYHKKAAEAPTHSEEAQKVKEKGGSVTEEEVENGGTEMKELEENSKESGEKRKLESDSDVGEMKELEENSKESGEKRKLESDSDVGEMKELEENSKESGEKRKLESDSDVGEMKELEENSKESGEKRKLESDSDVGGKKMKQDVDQ